MTKLEKPLKRELSVDGDAYVLTIEPERFRLVLKGHRKGLEFAWRDLLSGEAALAVALNASLKQQKFVHAPEPHASEPHAPEPPRRVRASKPKRTAHSRARPTSHS